MPLIEAILDEKASRLDMTGSMQGRSRRAATHALWICGCITMDDAPVWLIYEDGTSITWCRLPDEFESDDLVDTQHLAGGHADPDDVLAWLRGEAPDPFLGADDCGDPPVIPSLGRLLQGS